MSRIVFRRLVLLFWLLALPAAAQAQTSRQTFSLPLGPYAVGFRTINQFDSTRSFPRYDLAGDPLNPSGARPIQTSLWYPAIPDPRAPRMPFRRYARLLAQEEGFPPTTAPWNTWAERGLQSFYGTPDARFAQELAARTFAVENARPAAGRFPAVVYAPSLSAPSFENSTLCEYLASWGYRVAASPSLGPRSRAMTMDAAGLETQARDVAFLIGFLRRDPAVDPARLAVMGYSWGGFAAVLAKLRNDDIAAVISLDGSMRYYPSLLRGLPDADLRHLDVPFLGVTQHDESLEEINANRRDLSGNFYNAVRYSDASLLTFHWLVHTDFSANNLKLRERGGPDGDPNEEPLADANQGYQHVCLYVRRFLDAFLKHDPAAGRFLQNPPEHNGLARHEVSLTSKPDLPAPPTVTDLAHWLRQDGPDAFARRWRVLRRAFPQYTLPEDQLLWWGGELMAVARPQDAVAASTLAVELYPHSAAAYSLRGDAYRRLGERDLAIQDYRRALALNPQDSAGREKLNALERMR